MTTEDHEVIKRAWEYHKNADTLLASRFNYAMVAQAMLVVSYATLFASQWRSHAYTVVVEMIVAIFGLWFSWNQYLLSRSLVSKMEALRNEYLSKDHVFGIYLNAKPDRPRGVQTRRIPMGLAILWGILILMAVIPAVCP